MRLWRFVRGLSLGLALTSAPACLVKNNNKPECPKKKYEAPDERYVFFASGKTDVQADGYYTIGYVTAQLDANPALHVLVVGHADQRGKGEVNREASFKRARAVRKVLMEHGIKPARILIAASREQTETTLAQLGRRVDLFVYDPVLDEASKRLGFPVEIKAE